VTLEPGQYKVKELKIADITNRTSLKYSFNFKNYTFPELADQDLFINLCQENGTKYQVDFDGKNYQIFYYSYIYNDKQYWAFINQEEAKIFDAQFKLRLTNMIDEHGKSEADWTFIL